jgi:hypothetical protein
VSEGDWLVRDEVLGSEDEEEPQDGHHDDDEEDDDGACEGVGNVDACFGSGTLGRVDVVLLLLLLPPPNSACICAMNFATSGSLYVDSGAMGGAGRVSVLLLLAVLVLVLEWECEEALPFGAAPDDHIQPIFALMVVLVVLRIPTWEA